MWDESYLLSLSLSVSVSLSVSLCLSLSISLFSVSLSEHLLCCVSRDRSTCHLGVEVSASTATIDSTSFTSSSDKTRQAPGATF